MGLEAMNFMFFYKETDAKKVISKNKDITHDIDTKYIYAEKYKYWIDLQITPSNHKILSLRITLCNLKTEVLPALFKLLAYLFNNGQGILMDMKTKKQFDKMNEITMKSIEDSYDIQKEIFIGLYGDFTDAIGSEKLYKRRCK
jgi:hypothetical protein